MCFRNSRFKSECTFGQNLTIRTREKSDPNPAQKYRLSRYSAQQKYLGFLTVCKILWNFQLSITFG
jgi:hypothetical protein